MGKGNDNYIILVIDDDPVSQVLYQETLDIEGIKTHQAFSFKEGLDKFRNNYDTITAVIIEPDQHNSGYQTITDMLAFEKDHMFGHKPIIVVTADVTRIPGVAPPEVFYRSKGADLYLSKPINTEMFTKSVASVIEKYAGN